VEISGIFCILKGINHLQMPAKKTTAQFIESAKKIHGERYDYSLVEYVNTRTKVKIICKEHGVFEQIPKDHARGFGCAKCAGLAKYTNMEYLQLIKNVHGDRYDYSRTNYEGASTKITVICKEHGLFKVQASAHLRRNVGCKTCASKINANKLKSTTSKFIKKARLIHGNKYNYSYVKYSVALKEVKIKCLRHGIFTQVASYHLSGNGCPSCWEERRGKSAILTNSEFIEKARLMHGERYDYSLVEYKGNAGKVKIICKVHGAFFQVANVHLCGSGCSACKSAKLSDLKKLSLPDFLKKAKETHGSRYDYSQSVYYGADKKISIICKTHDIFHQRAIDHIRGRGCHKCSASKGETRIASVLSNVGVLFESEKRFERCKYKKPLPFDFYVSSHNLLIEYDGEQHYKARDFFGGDKGLGKTQKKDAIKTAFAKEHGFNLLRIPYTEYARIEEILSEALKLEYQPLQLSLFAA
jgi:very-short-patch-repair endonuclease